MIDKIYRVTASVLNLRAQPSTSSGVITTLRSGQAVARLDDFDHDGWYFVFADTPGEGLFVGYVFADYLRLVHFTSISADETHAPLPPDEDEDDDPSPDREPVGDIETPTAPTMRPPPNVIWTDGWNPEIPQRRVHESPNHGNRRNNAKVERVVIHITGTPSFDAVRDRFLNPNAYTSAHYLIEPSGALHQFVAEDRRAWHAGINKTIRSVYDRNDGSWRRFKRYFGWAQNQGWYPDDAVYFDENLNRLPPGDTARAKLVGTDSGGEWPDFAYFDQAWGRIAKPIGYDVGTRDPNNNSIGIEILSVGSKRMDPEKYTEQMYITLSALVSDICLRHSLVPNRETICGHEDVSPVDRWGWDPDRGFEWDRILGGAMLG